MTSLRGQLRKILGKWQPCAKWWKNFDQCFLKLPSNSYLWQTNPLVFIMNHQDMTKDDLVIRMAENYTPKLKIFSYGRRLFVRNGVPSLLPYKRWLIFMGMKQRKIQNGRLKKNPWDFQLPQFSIFFAKFLGIGPWVIAMNWRASKFKVAQSIMMFLQDIYL